jgi:Rod binding domain-containing protein
MLNHPEMPQMGNIGVAPSVAAARGRGDAGPRSAEAIQRTARDFEAVFLAEMMRPMFAEISAEAPFSGGFGEEIWRSMQVTEFGKALAARGGIGLADAVGREMLRLQDQASGSRR